jgi:hypothetical protein
MVLGFVMALALWVNMKTIGDHFTAGGFFNG